MRVLHLVLLILVLAVIGLSVMAYFDAAPIPALNEIAWGIKGWGPAKTPEEAVEKFNKALEKRNYAAASRYLDDEYQRKFRAAAKLATKFAEAGDNFRHTAKDRGIAAPQVEDLLLVAEPFPKSLKVNGSPKQSEAGDVASVYVDEEYTSSKHPGIKGRLITFKKVNETWRISSNLDELMDYYWFVKDKVVPIRTTRRQHLENIEKYGQDMTNALNVVKNRMKTDATTKENVSGDLEEEFRNAVKAD